MDNTSDLSLHDMLGLVKLGLSHNNAIVDSAIESRENKKNVTLDDSELKFLEKIRTKYNDNFTRLNLYLAWLSAEGGEHKSTFGAKEVLSNITAILRPEQIIQINPDSSDIIQQAI